MKVNNVKYECQGGKNEAIQAKKEIPIFFSKLFKISTENALNDPIPFILLLKCD